MSAQLTLPLYASVLVIYGEMGNLWMRSVFRSKQNYVGKKYFLIRLTRAAYSFRIAISVFMVYGECQIQRQV